MTVFGVAMVRDEADIIAETVGHMLTQVDDVIVADNMSQDSTPCVLKSLGIEVIRDEDPAYRQSQKMTRLASLAHERGADWVVPFDADEIWYSPFGVIADVLSGVSPQWLVASAKLYDHVATAKDGNVGVIPRMGWRRKEPAPMTKVACRWREDVVIEQGNHSASYEGGATVIPDLLVVRHYPYRSAEQFVRKAKNGAAAYMAADDLSPELGAHWRGYGAIAEAYGDEACADIFRKWFWSEDPENDDTLLFDPAPI